MDIHIPTIHLLLTLLISVTVFCVYEEIWQRDNNVTPVCAQLPEGLRTPLFHLEGFKNFIQLCYHFSCQWSIHSCPHPSTVIHYLHTGTFHFHFTAIKIPCLHLAASNWNIFLCCQHWLVSGPLTNCNVLWWPWAGLLERVEIIISRGLCWRPSVSAFNGASQLTFQWPAEHTTAQSRGPFGWRPNTGERQMQNERIWRNEKRLLPRELLQHKIIIKQTENGRCEDKWTRKLREENNIDFVNQGRVCWGSCLLM